MTIENIDLGNGDSAMVAIADNERVPVHFYSSGNQWATVFVKKPQSPDWTPREAVKAAMNKILLAAQIVDTSKL